MSELVQYFTRHYTLVLDNDQSTYNETRRAAREAISEESPDLTLAQYLAMSSEDKRTAYAYTIGVSILGLIEEWTDEIVNDAREDIGALLIREILITTGSDLAYELGAHYLPQDADAADFLSDEPDDDDCDCGDESCAGETPLTLAERDLR